jgi:histidinol-phosphate aminotransferase
MSALIQRLVRPEIQSLSAYPVPAAADMVKLDAMENPYGWPPAMQSAWLECLGQQSVNRYPDPQAYPLKQALRDYMQVAPGYDLLLGNGSDELIQIMALALARPGAVVMAPEPSFVMFRMIAIFTGMRFVGVPLQADFQLDVAGMQQAMAEHQPALLFLAQPNNPTGNLYQVDALEQIVAAAPGLVVIDEAYLAFSDRQHLHWLDQHDNLVIMRTLSKIGLAGLRLGVLIGKPEWLQEFDKLRLPYNINTLTQASARFALQQAQVIEEQVQVLRQQRARLQDQLRAMPLAQVWESQANFILIRCHPGQARTLFDYLRSQRILIKCLDGAHPMLQDCLRITVGTPHENDQLLAAMASGLAQLAALK